MDYLHDLEKHGVSLTEYPLLKVLDGFPLSGQKHHIKKFISLEMHPWLLYLQKALESFILAEVEVTTFVSGYCVSKFTPAPCSYGLVFIFSIPVLVCIPGYSILPFFFFDKQLFFLLLPVLIFSVSIFWLYIYG